MQFNQRAGLGVIMFFTPLSRRKRPHNPYYTKAGSGWDREPNKTRRPEWRRKLLQVRP